ncbi:DUF488 domain-containing protein [Nocardia arizonensis]|uniref:DUF488 domain-containing protein n=1 Tax=Nocardia arizonensis TaxID=1141647 RepID=UPI0006D02441|nr:DUF488 family protein [Nocardia arizonensis]
MSPASNPEFRVKRAYDAPETADGRRVLVDRLWPRGVRKEWAHIDSWPKALTPSTELRRWFHAEPGRRPEFEHRYRIELSTPEAEAELANLRAAAADGPVTLVTAVRDAEHSHVPVLLSVLRSG